MGAPPISDNAAKLRTWLMLNPRPSALRVYGSDGKEYDVLVRNGAPWSETATSIIALNPERVEANDDKGKLIRACDVAELLKKEERKEEQRAAVERAMAIADPETQRLIVFAELLKQHSEECLRTVRETTGQAFAQVQEICSTLSQQATAAQSAANELTVGIRNLIIQHAHEIAERDREQPAPSPLEQLAGNFLNGAQLAEAEKAATQQAAKPNGKH